MMFDPFQFLRPWFLLLVVIGIGLAWLWYRLNDPTSRWTGLIAPHLLKRLLVGEQRAGWLRPMSLVGVAIALAGIASAGPTWHKEPLPFGQDRAPMMMAVDLSRTMDAIDVPPTRLERIKQKMHDLVALRAGARTGLVAYAGTAHLVLPPSEDPGILATYLAALGTDLMPVGGRKASAALAIAQAMLDREQQAGTVLFLTDGIDAGDIATFAELRKRSPHQVLMLGVGTSKGGPLQAKDGTVALDAQGVPIQARFDGDGLRRFSVEADVAVAGVTLDGDDLAWVERRARRHLEAAQEENAELRWREYGYWLTFPVALLVLLWFRRGFAVRWIPCLLLIGLLWQAPPAAAQGSFVDLWLTPDQQGRFHFDRGEYAEAAEHFEDAQWKGLALYRAGKHREALAAFATLQTPQAMVLMGNCYARLKDYKRAVLAYEAALKLVPGMATAAFNRDLVRTLIAEDDQQQGDPAEKPDDVVFDDKGKKGKAGMVEAPVLKQVSPELWMRNLTTSPAAFLKQKFAIQASEGIGTVPTSGSRSVPAQPGVSR